ncbi:MAG: zinc-ribbon domain containing protein [bacterium]
MEEYQDQTITCKDCGGEFTFTAREQAFYAEKGLRNAPTRCKPCRDKRKQDMPHRGGGGGGFRAGGGGGRGPRPSFTVSCSACGVETTVPFEPVNGKPVYCRDCFQKFRPAR